MKIELTKAHVLIKKELPKGTVLDVTTDKGNELIEEGVAKELGKPAKRKIKKIAKKLKDNEELSNFDNNHTGEDASDNNE